MTEIIFARAWLRQGCPHCNPPASPSSQVLDMSAALPVDKRSIGLYSKFRVERTDGTSAPDQKHDDCDYFVLDLTHDPYAVAAIEAYAKACRGKYMKLSDDLRMKAAEIKLRDVHIFGYGENRDVR